MAATQGKKSFGMVVKYGTGGSPDTYVAVDEVFSVGAIGSKGDLVDFTHHGSPGGFMEWQASDLEDGNEVSVECNEVPGNTSQNFVRSARENAAKYNWQIIFPNSGRTFSFPGFVTSVETDGSDMKGRQVFRFTLKIAGYMSNT